MREARALRRGDRGQAVVEFALVLPFLALLVLGLAQFGLILNARQQIEDTARQGARAFALTADVDASVAAVRLTGRQVPRFAELSDLSLEAGGSREVRERTVRYEPVYERRCRRFLGVRHSCRNVFVGHRPVVEERVTTVTLVTLRASGGLLDPPRGHGTVKPGDWVTVTVTYAYPNPIQASVLGFRLPESLPLTTRAVARMEAGRE